MDWINDKSYNELLILLRRDSKYIRSKLSPTKITKEFKQDLTNHLKVDEITKLIASIGITLYPDVDIISNLGEKIFLE